MTRRSPRYSSSIRTTTSFLRGGKIWDRIKAVAEANSCIPNMLQVLNAARSAELRVFYALYHRYRQGDYETWKYIMNVSGEIENGKDPRTTQISLRGYRKQAEKPAS